MKQLLAIFLIGISCFLFSCEQYEAAKHSYRGLAYYRQGKLDEAIAEYKKALTINPDDAKTHGNLGVAYGEQGKYDLEIASFQKVIAINPDDAEAHYNLGVVYDMQGKSEKAIESFQKAISINPKYLEMGASTNWGRPQTDNDFDNIREIQEFKQLIKWISAKENLGIIPLSC